MANTEYALPKIEEDKAESNNLGGIATYSAKRKTTVKQTSVDNSGNLMATKVVEKLLSK